MYFKAEADSTQQYRHTLVHNTNRVIYLKKRCLSNITLHVTPFKKCRVSWSFKHCFVFISDSQFALHHSFLTAAPPPLGTHPPPPSHPVSVETEPIASSHCNCGGTGSMRPRNASIYTHSCAHTHTHTLRSLTTTRCPASFAGHCIWHVATISPALHTYTHIHTQNTHSPLA